MRKVALFAVSLLILGFLVSPTMADPTAVLSSPSDLSNLAVGDQFRVDVQLQGLDVGNDFVFVLNTQLSFPGALLDPIPDPLNPSGLTPGPILVTAAQRTSFNAVSSLTDGTVTGNFSDLSPVPSQAISQNGTYYSFLLRAQAPGSSSIAFTSGSYASTSSGFNLVPLPTGGPLAFTINGTAIPEPSSLALIVTGAMLGMIGCGFRRGKESTDAI